MNQDFLEIFRALFATETKFLVIGAFAVSIHAEPRATGDLDLWIEPTPENAERAFAALKSFGAPLADLTVTDLSTKNVVFQMGLPPNRIDIMTSIDGVGFDKAWNNRTSFELEKMQIPVIGKAELIANKKATGRPKDRLDLELLKKK